MCGIQSVSVFYINTELYHSAPLFFLFCLIPCLALLLILLIKKNKLNSATILNFIFGISFSAILFGVAIAINVIIGSVSKKDNQLSTIQSSQPTGIIFEPNTVAHYQTTEFDYNAIINSIGLRNKEIKTAKPDSIYRILCLGDSWTFGWGVNVEESWPMQLETFLKNKEYKHIEIINCGRPGQYTTTHKKYLAELIPKLQPDLILLGVLQLDDLAQLYEHTYFSKNNQKKTPEKSGSFESVKKLLSTFVFNSFSQYIRIFKPKNIKPHANEAIDIKKRMGTDF